MSQAVHTRLGFTEVERLVSYVKLAPVPAPPPAVRRGNLGDAVPASLPEELVTVLASGAAMRVERIVSRGHATPPDTWYDQDQDELVILVAGSARLRVEGLGEITLSPGDWIDLPRGVRHRVEGTDPAAETVWLAVFRGG